MSRQYHKVYLLTVVKGTEVRFHVYGSQISASYVASSSMENGADKAIVQEYRATTHKPQVELHKAKEL